MRPLLAVLVLLFGLQAQASGQATCTGLCLQKVSCTGGKTTTITGVVYAPNGIDPIPNVTVYIPNAPVDPFTPGVSCPVIGTPPSGSPLVGASTAFDGSFQLTDVPVGSNIPIVIVSGRWRRQVVIPTVNACTDNAFSIRFPKNSSEGDIPKIAVATGSVDSVECVLRKVGIDDSEFTNPSGAGRINLFEGDGGSRTGGAVIDASSGSESSLMGNATLLNSYDVLMLPCEGGNYLRAAQQLANLISFTNAGGRVYSSHFAYAWMYQNPPFNQVVNWAVTQGQTQNTGAATVDTTFAEGKTLSQWLQYVGASTTPGQISVDTIKHDLKGVVAPTQSWLTLNNALGTDTKPVMQFVFDTPVGTSTNQCGRVLFNEYHVESSSGTYGLKYPTECSSGAMTPQEKLLEYSLFALTSDGGLADLQPTTDDFGSVPIGFSSGFHTFTWTNNSTFAITVTSVAATGDYVILGNGCSTVPGGGSCAIYVAFKPTALGTRTGVLSVGAGVQTLTASLTGVGTADITVSQSSLNFGNVDITIPSSINLTITSTAPAAIPFPALVTTGDYTAASTCGSSLPALATCTITVTFTPSAVGPRTGTLVAANATTNLAYSPLNLLLTGNGVDFSMALSPTSGNVIAGLTTKGTVTLSPIAGFNGNVVLTCTTTAPAGTCDVAAPSFNLTTFQVIQVTFGTGSKYTVIGYGGAGNSTWLALLAMAAGALLWFRRRSAGRLLRCVAVMVLFAASGVLLPGCSGKLPGINATYTSPGTYTYTLSATDGKLTRTATYSLNVTAK